jgi:hypothetical protein
MRNVVFPSQALAAASCNARFIPILGSTPKTLNEILKMLLGVLDHEHAKNPGEALATRDILFRAGLPVNLDRIVQANHLLAKVPLVESRTAERLTQWRRITPGRSYPKGKELVWRGLKGQDLIDSPAFRQFKNLNFATFVWGSDTNAHDSSIQAIAELFDFYRLLQDHEGALASADILAAIPQEQRLHRAIRTPQALDRGFQWLDLQAFPILREGIFWEVRGLAKRRFFTLDPENMAPSEKMEWLALRKNANPQSAVENLKGPESPYMKHETAQTLKLIFLSNGIPLSEASEKINTEVPGWINQPTPLTPESENRLEKWKQRTGINPVTLKTTYSRSELALPANLNPVLLGMTRSQCISIFRQMIGVSAKTVAQMLGISSNQFHRLQNGNANTNNDFEFWNVLSRILGVDVHRFLGGRKPSPRWGESKRQRRSLRQQLHDAFISEDIFPLAVDGRLTIAYFANYLPTTNVSAHRYLHTLVKAGDLVQDASQAFYLFQLTAQGLRKYELGRQEIASADMEGYRDPALESLGPSTTAKENIREDKREADLEQKQPASDTPSQQRTLISILNRLTPPDLEDILSQRMLPNSVRIVLRAREEQSHIGDLQQFETALAAHIDDKTRIRALAAGTLSALAIHLKKAA